MRPALARLVRLDLVERGPGHGRERRVPRVQVREQARRQLVGLRRAARAAVLPGRVEHEVLQDELPPALEEVDQRHLALRALEDVGLVDRAPSAAGGGRP